MIPKDSNSNHYLKESQAEKKGRLGPSAAVGRTVRQFLADCPSVRRGPSARVEGAPGSIRGSGLNNRSSAPGCRTVRVPRGLSAGASRTVRACRAQVGPDSRAVSQADRTPSPNRKEPHLFPSLLLSLKKGPPLLGTLFGALPGPSEHIPGLSARFSTMSSGYFSNNHSLSPGFGARRWLGF
jgi:hypothetical protein